MPRIQDAEQYEKFQRLQGVELGGCTGAGVEHNDPGFSRTLQVERYLQRQSLLSDLRLYQVAEIEHRNTEQTQLGNSGLPLSSQIRQPLGTHQER